jgi:hypothetical protein
MYLYVIHHRWMGHVASIRKKEKYVQGFSAET